MIRKTGKILLILALFTGLALCLFLAGVILFVKGIASTRPNQLVTSASPGLYGAEVNVFSGTGGYFYMCGHNTPAACVPFGMARLAPDTLSVLLNIPGLNRSGYYYNDNKIMGFSHTRLVGADAAEGGVLRVLPVTADRAPSMLKRSSRWVRFSHRNERAFPGYYALRLFGGSILAELTASTRGGAHRYTFAPGVAPCLLVDITSALGDKGRVENAAARFSDDRGELSGSLVTYGSFSGRYGGLHMYFVARFSESPVRCEVWQANQPLGEGWQAAGSHALMALYFAPRTAETLPIEIRVGLSAVSIAGARANLEAELAGRPFDDILEAAKSAWEEMLSRIRVEGGTPAQRRVFYTALYRAFQMPTVFSDVDGHYPGFDGATHLADGFRYYTDFSLWDTFRTVMPLYYLVAPDESRDMLRSLLVMAEQGGGFPRWPSGKGYTGCMFGSPADITISEAWQKGLHDFDGEKAYAILRRVATKGPPPGSRAPARDGLAEYATLGWVPGDRYEESVAKTLEYAWADDALARFAALLGHADDATLFRERADRYRLSWHPGRLFFLPRDGAGKFIDFPFDPLKLTYTDFKDKYTRAYVEGSAMQWRWAVPFDPEGLVALFPSPERFVDELEAYMAGMRPEKGWWHPGGNYWHGNEPYFHAPWLFLFAGRPDRARFWVRRCLDTRYGDDPVGLDGNDDGGTLSAWYVWSALGLYPQAGSDRYWLGAPLFDRAILRVADHKTLEIRRDGPADPTAPAMGIHADDQPIKAWTLNHQQLTGTRVLRFTFPGTP